MTRRNEPICSAIALQLHFWKGVAELIEFQSAITCEPDVWLSR